MSEKPIVEVGSKSFTAVAVNTAAKAGEWMKSKVGHYADLTHKQFTSDLVTDVDQGAEKMIRNLIRVHLPDHVVLGEEGTGNPSNIQHILEHAHEIEYMWIVDPLDGTTNFVHGFPCFSVSLALAHRGEIIVGVVYDPCRDEMFVAEKGKGAYLKTHKLRVSNEQQLSDSLIATGFPIDPDHAQPLNTKGLLAMIPKVRNIRSVGSAALHLAYVAAGRLSGYWEIGLHPWDLAAGALLVMEAGGRVTDINGQPYGLTTRNILASNGFIHDEMQQQFLQLDVAGSLESSIL